MLTLGTPLHTFRRVTPLSQGVAISPLAHLALKTLDQPTVNRLMELRLGIRLLVSPDLRGTDGPMSELGLVTVATDVSLMSNQMDHVYSAREKWATVLTEHNIPGARFWQETFNTLNHLRDHPRRWKSTHGGTHLKISKQWLDWVNEQERPSSHPPRWAWPNTTQEQKLALIEAQFLAGRLDMDSVLDHSLRKLSWLAKHCQNPQAVCDRLPQAIQAGFSYHLERAHYRSGRLPLPTDRLDDEDVCQTYDILTERLGQWQEPPWENIKAPPDFPESLRSISVATCFPQLHARWRQHRVGQMPAMTAAPTRNRFRP